MSGPHPELPHASHPLGYSEAEARRFLGYQWKAFEAWLRQDLLSWDQGGQARYWPGNIHHFLHQGELFKNEEVVNERA